MPFGCAPGSLATCFFSAPAQVRRRTIEPPLAAQAPAQVRRRTGAAVL